MSIRHRIGMCLKTLFVDSVLITTACSTEPATTSLPAVEPEDLAVAAINRFQTEFGRQVIDAPTVRVPDDLDLAAVATGLDTPRQVTTASLVGGLYWEITRIKREPNYWRVDMASLDDGIYFAGSLFFRVNDAGEIERIDPADLGVTPTTSVS